MKKWIIALLLLGLTAGTATGTMTYDISQRPTAYYWTGNLSADIAYLWANEQSDITEGWTFESLTTLTFPTNGATIDNATNGTITFTEAGEDLDLTFTSNVLTLGSPLGIVELAFGTVDSLTGVGGITFDAAASAITLTSDGAADDLSVALAGATDSSLVLSSTGTGVDAIIVSASAGGLDIDAVEASTVTVTTDGAAEDLTISVAGATDSSLILSSTGTGADAMSFTTSAGGMVIDSAGAVTYKAALYADSRIIENHSASHTLTSPTNIGTLITVDTAAVVITLPAVETGATYTIMNIGADGTEIHVDVNSGDRVLGGCEFGALDDGDQLTNTGATADKGDYVTLTYGTAVGWFITEMNGIWADGG